MFKKILFLSLILISCVSFASSTGLLELKQDFVQDMKQNGITHRLFIVKVPEATKPSKGVVVCKRMDGKFNDFYIDIKEDGTISQKDGKMFCLAMNCGYGEKFEILLASLENDQVTPIAKCTIVPFPIFVKGEDG